MGVMEMFWNWSVLIAAQPSLNVLKKNHLIILLKWVNVWCIPFNKVV